VALNATPSTRLISVLIVWLLFQIFKESTNFRNFSPFRIAAHVYRKIIHIIISL